MTDIDDVVRRAVDTITMVAGRAAAFSTRVLLVTTLICVGGFLLGVAALSGGIETVWIVLGICFGSIAIGGAFVARWRVGAVRRHVPELVEEFRQLASRDTTRTVVESFTVDSPVDSPVDGRPNQGGSTIVMSRHLNGFRGAAGAGFSQATRLNAALTALTTFPVLMIVAILISAVFGFLGLIFLIALAL